MSATDHLAQAKKYFAIAEAADSKAAAYERTADEIIAAQREDPTLGRRTIAEWLGCSKSSVDALVSWRTSGQGNGQSLPFGGASNNARTDRSKARQVLRDPEQRKQVIAALDSEQIEEVIQELHGAAMDRIQAKRAERQVEPSAGDLMGDDQFDPSESWADTEIIRVREKAHALRRQVEKWGLVLGGMDEEQAFEYLQESERNIAEVRAALQERMADRSRAEV